MSPNRAARRRPPSTLLESAVARVGLTRGTQAVGYYWCFAVARSVLGRAGDDLSVDDVAGVWGVSRAQMFRRQQAFRSAFPGQTPGRLMDSIEGEGVRIAAARAAKALRRLEVAARGDSELYDLGVAMAASAVMA